MYRSPSLRKPEPHSRRALQPAGQKVPQAYAGAQSQLPGFVRSLRIMIGLGDVGVSPRPLISQFLVPGMLNVFLTVDVEVWCDGWTDLGRRFPEAFQRYVYGKTAVGEFGLRYQTELLQSHGLRGVFFVEPLFSGRFGPEPLAEIVSLLLEQSQEIQLHLHTEWLDEWPLPLLPGPRRKRQFMRDFSREEQQILINEGARRLRQAGAPEVNCFRAGSFGFNSDTLDALAACGIAFDSSYNGTLFGPDSGVAEGVLLTDVHRERGVTEIPMTVYRTGGVRLRHAQLGACSWTELERLLWKAAEAGRSSFVLLWHNFELLSPSKRRADPVVVSRLRRLCSFLDRHRDTFCVRGFHGLGATALPSQPAPLKSSMMHSAWRMAEQVYRRRYA